MLADGPVAYWRLGETSGTTAVDATGNGHTGTYTGGVTLGVAAGLVGDTDKAARFDGVNDSVDVPDAAAFRLNGSFSIEFWAKQDSFVNSTPSILGKGNSANPNGYAVYADSQGALWFRHGKHTAGSGSGSLTASFRYFVVTYDAPTKKMRWYVNGVITTTTTVGFPNNNGNLPFEIGGGDAYGNNDLDEIALYSTVLSAARIAAHYAAGS